MTAYGFQPFLRQENSGKEFAIPEITDGFLAPGESDAAGDAPEITAAVEGMVPVSFMTEELPRGTYRVQITLRALDDVEQLMVFAGRKQLRAVVSLKKRGGIQSCLLPASLRDHSPVAHGGMDGKTPVCLLCRPEFGEHLHGRMLCGSCGKCSGGLAVR